ncbi:unnamed protein product [Acanthoscelides obtectus]|uniref:Uncharacterized protein n=1 Tax=Acanthoscelides obtectus TaxID=200917 RepID=A0A9P0KP66_ACAOB|nr:unnamed protein product [Acanthoscelides obtectus]CAK1647399.1 hypothetical protein AOBTE_LOCUS15210 [Acanthoscelides obtectus]
MDILMMCYIYVGMYAKYIFSYYEFIMIIVGRGTKSQQWKNNWSFSFRLQNKNG